MDAIQNFLNFSFVTCSCSCLLWVSEALKKSGNRARGGEGEGEKRAGCFETPVFRADVDGMAGVAASGSGSDSESDDDKEDEDSEEGSVGSTTGCGASNFAGFLVSFSDSDSEEEEEEDEDEKACRLLRFL